MTSADQNVSRNKRALVRQYGLPEKPFGEFMLKVSQLKNSDAGRASKIAGFYLSAFSNRRKIMAEANAKMQRVWDLRSAIAEANRTIVFAGRRVTRLNR